MAFREWANVTPFKFSHVQGPHPGLAHISISFEVGKHGDSEDFTPDGPLAHSFGPPIGIIHFNGEMGWAHDGDSYYSFDIKSVALHEIGHLLGLNHSADRLAIMFPTFDRGEIRRIHQDDVNGIYHLYGFEN
ncbi:metalloendoprotein 1-like [Dorcoceras hygrometricum]|uniref:Metalloendoprotein 1-like n=1 Tax=Dorcoceras hygrometricum TaxID=472368 RepID=A0A2Z7DA33_9LAMI|nr:metalloendoprotein 1-like [Dorcoceras hygrometricum]